MGVDPHEAALGYRLLAEEPLGVTGGAEQLGVCQLIAGAPLPAKGTYVVALFGEVEQLLTQPQVVAARSQAVADLTVARDCIAKGVDHGLIEHRMIAKA